MRGERASAPSLRRDRRAARARAPAPGWCWGWPRAGAGRRSKRRCRNNHMREQSPPCGSSAVSLRCHSGARSKTDNPESHTPGLCLCDTACHSAMRQEAKGGQRVFKILRLDECPSNPMHGGRGDQIKLIKARLGTEKIDVHLNRLAPGGARGKLHHHSRADNVYIVRRGEGTLILEDRTYTQRENDVVYIPAGA